MDFFITDLCIKLQKNGDIFKNVTANILGYFYFENREIPIDRGSEGFRLITRIQDEAHRFAIEYHRSLRTKDQVHSILDDIDGIGPARRKALMKAFQSLDDIKAADVETLAEVPSMNRLAAEKVYEFFHRINDTQREEER